MFFVFEATWQTVKKKKTEKVYFFMKTQLQLLCNRTFKTRTQDEMYITFHKIHLAYQAHESTHKMKCT